MKKKPRVVSKNAKAYPRFELQTQSGFDGVADTKPAAVTVAGGLAVAAGNLIGRVGRFYPSGYVPRSRNPAGFTMDLVDGGDVGNGFSSAQKQGALGAGGSLNMVGTFTSYHTGKKGKVLGATGEGYVTSSVAEFATFWGLGTRVNMELGRDGRNWTITPAPN